MCARVQPVGSLGTAEHVMAHSRDVEMEILTLKLPLTSVAALVEGVPPQQRKGSLWELGAQKGWPHAGQ